MSKIRYDRLAYLRKYYNELMKKSAEIAEQLKIEELYRDFEMQHSFNDARNKILPPIDSDKHYYVKRVKRGAEKYHDSLNRKFERFKRSYVYPMTYRDMDRPFLFEMPFLEVGRPDLYYQRKIRRKRSAPDYFTYPMYNFKRGLSDLHFYRERFVRNPAISRSKRDIQNLASSLTRHVSNIIFLSKRNSDTQRSDHNSSQINHKFVKNKEFRSLPKISREDFIKRIKRTSRKTEKLNQTSATVPKRY